MFYATFHGIDGQPDCPNVVLADDRPETINAKGDELTAAGWRLDTDWATAPRRYSVEFGTNPWHTGRPS